MASCNASPPFADDAADERDLADIPLFEGYSSGLLAFASASCVVFIVVGVPGNLVTIVALLRSRKVRSATAAFIVNLSVSDLLLGCVNLPLAAHTFAARRWPHGRLLCHVFPLLRYALVATSLLSVLAIGVNRYLLIAHPRVYHRVFSSRWALAAIMVVVWLLPVALLAPTLAGRWGRFDLDVAVGSCSIMRDACGRSPKEVLFVVAFALPAAAIVLCYARIFSISRRAALRASAPRAPPQAPKAPHGADNNNASGNGNGNGPNANAWGSGGGGGGGNGGVAGGGGGGGRMSAKDRRLLQMILVIFGAFVVCYLPITVAKTFLRQKGWHVLNIAAYVLVYLATCVNPFIYVVMSTEYRQAYTELLCCRGGAGGGGSGSGGADAAGVGGDPAAGPRSRSRSPNV